MDKQRAIEMLAALAQESRLDALCVLACAEASSMAAGEIA